MQKIFSKFTVGKKKAVFTSKKSDLYQNSLNEMGNKQFKELLKMGLKVPVVLL